DGEVFTGQEGRFCVGFRDPKLWWFKIWVFHGDAGSRVVVLCVADVVVLQI
ncbi:hypothetical protein A2U01_0100675, partial [Trifolium medium]|nr:hypothetical protein [Trifolium medium]